MFNDAIRDMQCLVKNINLSADVEKEVCDNLEDWKNKGISLSYFKISYIFFKSKFCVKRRQIFEFCSDYWVPLDFVLKQLQV